MPVTLKSFVEVWERSSSTNEVKTMLPQLSEEIILCISEYLINRGVSLKKFESCYPWEINY